MIYLNPQVRTSENEDTFWDWANRVFPKSSFEVPERLTDKDIVLRYSTLGFLPVAGKSVALCWEMFPKMHEVYGGDLYEAKTLHDIYETAKYCTYRSVATEKNAQVYQKYGSVEVIPIGINTGFWKPIDEKDKLREKYDIPNDKKVGIWVGTFHEMKGFSKLLEYASLHKDMYWIIVINRRFKALEFFENAKIFMDIHQQALVELINAADLYLCTNRLSSYFMVDWEAMACDVQFEYYSEVPPEFEVGENPRQKVFEKGWDRDSVQRKWEEFFDKHGVEYK